VKDHAFDAKLEEVAHQFRLNVSIGYGYDTHLWLAYVGPSSGTDRFSPEKALERAIRAADQLREEEAAETEAETGDLP